MAPTMINPPVFILEYYKTEQPKVLFYNRHKMYTPAMTQLEELVEEGYSGTIFEAYAKTGWYTEDELELINPPTPDEEH